MARETPAQLRERLTKRLDHLHTRRISWEVSWREQARFIHPRRTRFFVVEAVNAGAKREHYLINSTPRWALRTCAAGVMAGTTSPARPWMRFDVTDPALAQKDKVAEFLAGSTQAVLDACEHSNFYTSLQQLLEDLPLFGNGVMILEEDPEDVLRAYVLPIGSFYLAQNARGVVDTLFHVDGLTVGQVVERFGLENCTTRVQALYKDSKLDELIDVVHVIEPRRDHDPSKRDPKNMPWASVWFEQASGDAENKLLQESGYEECPVLAPRWALVGNDEYGYGPAVDVIGDCKSLQLYEREKARLVESIADPALELPGGARDQNVSLLAGARNYRDDSTEQEGAKAIYEVPPAAILAVKESIAELEGRIKQGFYVDLWLMMSEMDNAQPITAEEVRARSQEKLLQLGPVTERLQNEFQKPAVERAFGILYRRGMLPEIPDELRGAPLRIVFTSVMAQAQKAVSASATKEFAGFVGNVATIKPDVLDTVDADKLVRKYGVAMGVDPDVMVPEDRVTQMRAARAKQAAAQQAQANALATAQGAKTLSEANTGGSNLLSQAVGGVAAAQAGGG